MRFDQFLHLLQETDVVSGSVIKIGDEEQERLLGALDEMFLRIIKRQVVVLSAAELRAEEDVDRVDEVGRHVHHSRLVEKRKARLQDVEGGKDGGHDRAVN